MTIKLLEVSISGSFKATDGEIESYDNVKGLIPLLDDDKAQQMIIKRYAKIWIVAERKSDGETIKYKRVSKLREVFIDSVDEVEVDAELSYVGKDILTLSPEEIQDFAAANDLIGVPLYKQGSLAQARRIAYAEYANRVLGMEPKLKWTEAGFNPAKMPTIITDGQVNRSKDHVPTLEETIDLEQLILDKKAEPAQRSTGGALSLDQLKAIADQKKIPYNANIGYKTLYEKIYGKNPAMAA